MTQNTTTLTSVRHKKIPYSIGKKPNKDLKKPKGKIKPKGSRSKIKNKTKKTTKRKCHSRNPCNRKNSRIPWPHKSQQASKSDQNILYKESCATYYGGYRKERANKNKAFSIMTTQFNKVTIFVFGSTTRKNKINI